MNLAAVAANERLGSFEATTLAGGACASQNTHMQSSDLLQRVTQGVEDQSKAHGCCVRFGQSRHTTVFKQ